MLVREHFPQLPIHLSVQANAVNWPACSSKAAGLSRVILSRELSLEEIGEIRHEVLSWKFSFMARCAWPIRRLPLPGYIGDPNQVKPFACRWQVESSPLARTSWVRWCNSSNRPWGWAHRPSSCSC